jgi:uncharacterized protein YjdB
MNTVKIKFDPFRDKCTISLNDQPLEADSSLNSYVNQPLLVSAPELLGFISTTINDYFSLTIVGTVFEKYFLEDLRKGCDDCKEILEDEIINLTDRFEQASKRLNCDSDDYKEKVYVAPELDIGIDPHFAVSVPTANQASIGVAASKAQAEIMAAESSATLILYIAEEANISYVGKTKCLWGVDFARLSVCLQAAIERFAIPRYILQAEQLMQEQQDASTEAYVEALKRIDVSVTVSVKTEAIEGDIVTPVFQAEGTLPKIRMEVSNPQIVQVDHEKMRLLAVKEGTAAIAFYKDNEIDAFETVSMKVKPNNLLKKISLSAPEDMKPGRSYQVTPVFEPADSPEIASLQWEVQDPSVLQIDKTGNIRALKAGKTVVSAKAERISAEVEVNVLPGMEKIILAKDKVSLMIAQSDIIEVNVEPASCAEYKLSCKSTNPKVAIAQKNELGQWVVTAKGITAKGEGHCQLIFAEEGGYCKAICEVTVISSIGDGHAKGAFLSRTAIMTLIAFVLQFLPKPIGVFGAIAAGAIAVALGAFGIIKYKKDAFWEILLMALSVWIAVGSFMKL